VTVSTTIQLPRSQFDAFTKAARAEGRSLASWVRAAVANHVKKPR
jgi:Ribbon-helix-helix protein, copG family